MTIDVTTMGVLAGSVGTVAGVIGGVLTARTKRGEREDSALARVLERRDEDCRKLTNDLSLARTEADLRGAQVGDLGARVEMLMEQVAEVRTLAAALDAKNDDCERRNAELARRVYRLEKRSTPPDMPAVPTMHEEVGGHER